MAVWIVALILLAGAGLLIWLRRQAPQDPVSRNPRAPGRDPLRAKLRLRPQLERLYLDGRYWGVRVEAGMDACEAARRGAGERYSFENAPPLPLPDCALTRCSCRFAGLEEQRNPPPRRQTPDRREKIRYEPKRGNRRKEKDRRKLNKWDDQTNL